MPLIWAPYYGLARVNNSGPDVKNWAVTDTNPFLISLLLRRLELHHHNASTPMNYPGYNIVDPATPTSVTLTQYSQGGYISAGTTVGVRLSFVDQLGLETDGSPEVTIQMPPIPQRPNPPVPGAPLSTPVPGAVTGGTYVYAITKRKGTGETEISDVVAVQVPFDATLTSSYVVPFTLDETIAQYAIEDNTDSICIYRSTGYDSAFVRLKTLHATPDGYVTVFTDTGTIEDFTQQPPQGSEFGKQNLLGIDWSRISIPSDAYRLRIYLTQQPSVYATTNLFQDFDLKNPATPVGTNINYIGTEVMAQGYPSEFSQLMGGQSKIYLPGEAYGAPYYTEAADAQGWQTKHFVFGDQTSATPLVGNAYVDTSTGLFKVMLTTAGYTTLATPTGSYVHSTLEPGGHTASHIQFASNTGGPTMDQIGSIIATPVGNVPQKYRIQVQNIYKPAATPMSYQTTTATQLYMPDMDSVSVIPTGVNPDFAGQWFEVAFDSSLGQLAYNGQTCIASFVLELNGIQMLETSRSYSSTVSTATMYKNAGFRFATPLTRSNNRFRIKWTSTGGISTMVGQGTSAGVGFRTMLIREVF